MVRDEEIRSGAMKRYPDFDKNTFDHEKFIAFKEGANWADNNPNEGLVSIDTVCEWLEEHMNEFCSEAAEQAMISWLRKAMGVGDDTSDAL